MTVQDDLAQSSQALSRMLSWVQRLVLSVPTWVFALALPVVVVIHSGIQAHYLLGGVDISTEIFPHPLPVYESSSYGLRTLSWLLGITSDSSYLRLVLALSIAAVVALAFVCVRVLGEKNGKVLATVIALGPVGTTLMVCLGRVDLFMICGGLVLGLLARKISLGVLAGFIMAAGNPEQAVLATMCFVLVAWGLADMRLLRAGLGALYAAIVCATSLFVLFRNENLPSRVSVIGNYLAEGFASFVMSAPLEIYAGFGLGAIALFITFTTLRGIHLAAVIVGSLIVPVAVTAITADQTRVMVGLSTATVSALMLRYLPRLIARYEAKGYANAVASITLVALLLPAVSVAYPRTVVLPYQGVLEVIQQVSTF